jgi:excisionase family DNA binding protein
VFNSQHNVVSTPQLAYMTETIAPATVKAAVRSRFTSLAAQVTKQIELKKELYSDPLLSIAECRPALGDVSYSTFRKLIAAGKIRTWRPSPRGHHRIRLSELRRFIASGDQPGGVA